MNAYVSSLILVFGFSITGEAASPRIAPFYRAPNSSFVSGHSPMSLLFSNLKGQKTRSQAHVSKDGQQFLLERSDLLNDLDLSEKLIDLKTGASLPVSIKDDNTYWLLAPDGKRLKRTPDQLTPDPKDLGRLVTWKTSTLILEKEKTPTPIEKGTDFYIVRFQHEYALVQSVQNPAIRGYLSLADTHSKLDLAKFVWVRGQWLPVKYRTRDGLRVQRASGREEWLSPMRVEGVLTKPLVGILKSALPSKNLVVRSQVEILSLRSDTWYQSWLQDHGLVWWKPLASKAKTTLSLETILKEKTIFSVATPPNKPLPILVSAEGVYFSANGLDFVEIEQFRGQNWPVTIDDHGHLFVGYFKASDHSKLYFEPFLKPHELAGFFNSKNPKVLKISELYADANKLRLALSDGTRQLQIKAPNVGSKITEWKIW